MSRRGLRFSFLLCLCVLLISFGIDLHAVFSARNLLLVPAPAGNAFPLPGPRRYPPAYHAAALQIQAAARST